MASRAKDNDLILRETTLRGADLLASHLLLTRPTKLYTPDVFRGKPFPFEKDGDKEELGKFFAGTWVNRANNAEPQSQAV